MKNLKTLSIIFLSLLLVSCSKKDDEDEGGNPAQTEFTATINGGGFGNNYAGRLGSFSTDSTNGLTIAITDENNNVIRIFLNQTGGFMEGITKVVGDVDTNGFVTNVILRDQNAQVTYNSTDGEINITGNRENPGTESGRLISGNFNITATSGVGPTVTMTGNFKDMPY